MLLSLALIIISNPKGYKPVYLIIKKIGSVIKFHVRAISHYLYGVLETSGNEKLDFGESLT